MKNIPPLFLIRTSSAVLYVLCPEKGGDRMKILQVLDMRPGSWYLEKVDSFGKCAGEQENKMSEIIKNGNDVVVKPGIDVVASMAEDFRNELVSATEETGGTVTIDLEGVDMVDSVGIGVIIATHNSLSQAGRKLKVINVNSDIYGLFTTMRLNRRFDIEKNE